MRQAGILAAAGLKALDDYETGILLPSHMKAKLLANRLSDVPGLHVETDIVDTNIVLLTIELENIDAIAYSRLLKDKGVLVLPYGNKTLRMVTHRDITDEDIKTVITLVREVAARAWTDANSLTITGKLFY